MFLDIILFNVIGVFFASGLAWLLNSEDGKKQSTHLQFQWTGSEDF